MGIARSTYYHKAAISIDDTALVEPVAKDMASDDDPETVMSKLSDAKALRACLRALPAQGRCIVLLAFVQGLIHDEIAGRLKMPISEDLDPSLPNDAQVVS
ncbi:MAG: sigma factor-like helix-turn-helix DNA-binding protein [Pannonibacter sp.]